MAKIEIFQLHIEYSTTTMRVKISVLWVLKIAVLKYYSVSKRGTTAKSNPKQATDPISLHTKFGDNISYTFPLNEWKPCVTPDIGHRTPDGKKSKNNISTPQGGGHNKYPTIYNI